MKRFMKGCAITALVFGVLGMALATIGSGIAGRTSISDVVETATGGRVHVNSADWWKWGIDVGSGVLHAGFGERDDTAASMVDNGIMTEEGAAEYDGRFEGGAEGYEVVQDNDAMFDRRYDILKGTVEKYCPGEGIQELDIELGGCSFNTAESDDGRIYLEVSNAYRFQSYVKDDTLHIKAKTISMENWSKIGDCFITLYLPSGYRFKEVDVEMGAGECYLTDLQASEASVEVGAGVIEMYNVEASDLDISVGAGSVNLWDMQVSELDVEVGMGSVTATGSVNKKADIECSMGYVEMTVDGKEQDFNYQLEGSMGEIQLGSKGYGGFADEREINNHASKDMEIECAMGNISITFTE